jgi:hypothetical protein
MHVEFFVNTWPPAASVLPNMISSRRSPLILVRIARHDLDARRLLDLRDLHSAAIHGSRSDRIVTLEDTSITK